MSIPRSFAWAVIYVAGNLQALQISGHLLIQKAIIPSEAGAYQHLFESCNRTDFARCRPCQLPLRGEFGKKKQHRLAAVLPDHFAIDQELTGCQVSAINESFSVFPTYQGL